MKNVGIKSRLNYFEELGIEATWISPIYKSPMKDFGYDISDFRDIEPIFGNMAIFEELSDELKRRSEILMLSDFCISL